MEQTYNLPKENLSLMMLSPKDILFLRGGGVGEHQTAKDQINMGDIIVKSGMNIEGFTFRGTLFKVIGRIDAINGVDINSFILKEVTLCEDGSFVETNSNRQKVTINKHICERIGIEFQQGLELWPMETNFVRYEDYINGKKPMGVIDYSDMGTYPTDITTGLVHKICVELTGFRFNDDGTILTPAGNTIPLQMLLETIKFTIGKTHVQHNLISKDEVKKNDKINTLCFELDVLKSIGGINTNALKGRNIDDIVNCTWKEYLRVEPRRIIEVRPRYSAEVPTLTKTREAEIFDKLNRSMMSFENEMRVIEKRLNGQNFKIQTW